MIKLFHSGTGKYVIFNDLNNHFRKCYGKNVKFVKDPTFPMCTKRRTKS